jgi:hypothetical protein
MKKLHCRFPKKTKKSLQAFRQAKKRAKNDELLLARLILFRDEHFGHSFEECKVCHPHNPSSSGEDVQTSTLAATRNELLQTNTLAASAAARHPVKWNAVMATFVCKCQDWCECSDNCCGSGICADSDHSHSAQQTALANIETHVLSKFQGH